MKSVAKMSEPSHKPMKLTTNLPEDIVEHIMSLFLPIQSFLRTRSVSKRFKNVEILSRDLDFSGIFSVERSQLEAVRIIESVFNEHKGSEINRFVLLLDDHIGVEDKIHSWINTCLGKNIQELVLDFSKSKKVLEIPVDFSAIETLTVLKLRRCKFEIPKKSPKGLKLLRTLSLMKTEVNKKMIDAIFKNCIHLEMLELIKCEMYGILSIKAQNHKKFKSLVVSSMPYLVDIVLDAPTLECYTYDGLVTIVDFARVYALKEAKLNYKRSHDSRDYGSSDMVLANMDDYVGVQVLATTQIFLEALRYGHILGAMRKWWNLKEFKIVIRAPTYCSLYDIAEFLQQCPNLKRVLIDINDFTFEPKFYRELNHNYELDSIKEVEISGYKGHWHEIDIVHFFLWNAESLEELILTTPKNKKIKLTEHDYARVNYIKSISPRRGLIKLVEG